MSYNSLQLQKRPVEISLPTGWTVRLVSYYVSSYYDYRVEFVLLQEVC